MKIELFKGKHLKKHYLVNSVTGIRFYARMFPRFFVFWRVPLTEGLYNPEWMLYDKAQKDGWRLL